MWGDDSDEDEEPQEVVVKGPEETGTKSMDTTAKTDEPTEEEKAEAATKIQAVQRGKAVRQEMQAREEAATKIQAVQRGKMTRETMKQEAVDNSNAQKETTKPKPHRPQRADNKHRKKRKRALPKNLFAVTALMTLYRIASRPTTEHLKLSQKINSACWKPSRMSFIKRAA